MSKSGSKMELYDIRKKLQEDGLDPACSEEQKLRHLWQLYVKTEANLKASVDSIDELQHRQTEEMKEVENYVEHIRNLSEEREALTLEFETENEQLKAEIEQLKDQLAGSNDEIREMLTQQDLDDIACGTTSEQIAYLLVERARLMDELEAEQSRNQVVTTEGTAMNVTDLQELLEQERHDFEEELQNQRESMRMVKEQMKQVHEEEMNAMVAENEKLQDMLDDARKKAGALEENVVTLTSDLQAASNNGKSDSSSELEAKRLEDAITQADQKVLSYQRQVEELEADNKTLAQNLRGLTLELQNERSQHEEDKGSGDATSKKLQQELERANQKIQQLDTLNDNLTKEKKTCEMRLDFAQRELEELRIREREFSNEKRSLKSTEEELISKYRQEVDNLRHENQKLELELQSTKDTLQRERDHAQQMDERVKTIQSTLAEGRTEHENEQSTLKNKVRSLELRVNTLEGDLANGQRELLSAKTEHKRLLAQARVEATSVQATLDEELQARRMMERELNKQKNEVEKSKKEVEESLARAEQQLTDSKYKLDEANRAKDKLQAALDEQKKRNSSFDQEQLENLDRIKVLEQLSSTLETDNEEVARQLTESKSHCRELEDKLQKDRSKNAELERSTDVRLNQAYQEVEELTQELKRVTADLRKKESELDRTKAVGESEKVKSESTIAGLKADLEEIKHAHKTEIDTLNARQEQLTVDVKNTKNELTAKEEQVAHLREEVKASKSQGSRLEGQLEAEVKGRTDLENRNTTMEQEMNKVLGQMRELRERISFLETAKENLECELERKYSVSRETETILNQRSANQGSALKLAQNRAEAAEKRLYELQSDLEEAMSRLKSAEQTVRETSSIREELADKGEEIIRLRNQLQEERLNSTMTNQSSETVMAQMQGLREREQATHQKNKELQHMLLDFESKLDCMKDHTKSASSMRQEAAEHKTQLSDQMSSMQREIDTLKVQLMTVTEKYDEQLLKYNERKLRTKNKLHKARDLLISEKGKMRGEMEKLQHDMALAKARLTKEHEWKDKMEESYKILMLEKRDLLAQIAENEETTRDQSRALSVLEVRVRYLEEENGNLQDRIDSLTKQKHTLDRIVKEYQMERQKEVQLINRSATPDILPGLISPRNGTTTNGLRRSWDNHLIDAVISPRLSPRTQSPVYGVSNRQNLSSSMPFDVSNLSQESDGVDV